MVSPQKENGYTQIANELMERLCYPGINGSEYRVLLLVIRKTYGFHKKVDRISLTQFQSFTLMNRAQAVETIKSLLEKRILIKEDGQFAFNKNYHEWETEKRGSMQKHTGMEKHTTASMQKHTKSSMQKHTHKRKKETITKETYRKEGSEIIKALELVDPKNKDYYGNTTQREACDFLLGEYGLTLVVDVITNLLPHTNQLPYFPTITTPVQLRDKWVQLHNTVERKKGELLAKKVKVI